MRSVLFVALVVMPGVTSLPVGAQRVAPSECTYDTCALRVESGKIVRGITGEKVERFGLFGNAEVAKHVRLSDSAVVYARMYERNQVSGFVVLFIGEGVALGALGYFDAPLGVGLPSISTTRGAIAIGGLGIMLYGARRLSKANRGLSRAIWWYNRDLAMQTSR